MKIIYLHHSGFLIELNNATLIFDAITNIPPHFLRKGVPHYFFATHAHKDHFDQRILSYGSNYDTKYIFSDDIPFKSGRKITYVKPNQSFYLDTLRIDTFGSTDRGVSFMVRTDSHTIFHSGDLNWWDWDTKSHPHIDPAIEERDFKAVIDLISTFNPCIDVAFVPVDPRLGDSYSKTAEYFYATLKPKVLIPMHLWDAFETIDKLKADMPRVTILTYKERNQVIVEG